MIFFLPCLVLYLLTLKKIFLIGMGLSLVPALMSVLLEGGAHTFGAVTANKGVKTGASWVLFALGAVVIYFMMH